MRNPKSLRRLVGGIAIILLAAIVFACGAHLTPESESGRDLLRADAAIGQPVAAAPGNVVMASVSAKRGRVADMPMPGSSLSISSGDATSPAATFQDICILLKRNFVDGVPDDSKLGHGAAAAMISSLQDPNSRFFEPAEFAEAQHEANGQFAGIGAVLAVRSKTQVKTADDPTRDKDHPDSVSYELTVVAAVPGGPADKAGLKTGDVITDIDGHWIATYDLVSAASKQLTEVQSKNDPVALNNLVDALQKKLDNGLTLDQAENKLATAAAKPLVLSVKRPGATKPITFTVQPVADTSLQLASARMLTGNIGYIKINEFNSDTAAAFKSALASIGDDPKGVILDLRDATGDSLAAGAAVASHLSTARLLGYEITKGGKVSPIPITSAKTIIGPVEVLIGGGTANVAELVASALQGAGAKLIGSDTFGDASDVESIALRDGSGFTMTVGQLQTAAKADFEGSGIRPDIAVTETPGLDNTLNQAVMELSGRVARLPAN